MDILSDGYLQNRTDTSTLLKNKDSLWSSLWNCKAWGIYKIHTGKTCPIYHIDISGCPM